MINYGYYTQRYLSAANGFSIDGDDPDHKPMEEILGNDYTDDDANRVREAIGAVQPVVRKSEDVSDLGVSLVLDSDTAISVTFNVASDYSGEVTATIEGSPATITQTKAGKYKVVVKDIGANRLAKKYGITITTSDCTEISISALNYVDIGLQNLSTQAQRNALIAIYDYYAAAEAYVNSLSG